MFFYPSSFPLSISLSGCPGVDGLVTALWLAWLLDLLIGDPRWLPHPVNGIARIARAWERWCGRRFGRPVVAGCVCTALTLITVAGLTLALLALAARAGAPVLTGVSILLLASGQALRGLASHGLAVYRALVSGGVDLAPARARVAWLVSRDTGAMDRAGIIRACVESVAENMADGVVAPFCFALAGGLAALAVVGPAAGPAGAALFCLLYKSVNTMDSLFGYRNEKYLLFGRCPARLDDAVNWLPARISALALICVSISRGSGRRAWRTWRRDAARHASPNGGHPEAAMAGILGIRLGGPGRYFGRTVKKNWLGSGPNEPEPSHIRIAVLLVILSSCLVLVLATGLLLLMGRVIAGC